MKMNLFAAAAVVLLAATAGAAQPESLPMTSLSLEVKNVASGRQASNSYVTDWGSYDKTFTRQREIAITLRNLSDKRWG